MPEMPEEEVIAHLTQVKGVGVWTAHMFLMFTLRRPDILPVGDYGVQAAIKKHYKKRKWPKPAVMEKIAKPWAPYRSIACWYLWRSLGYQDGRKIGRTFASRRGAACVVVAQRSANPSVSLQRR
jgi:3-methyladenine DNA glycosylase/8-oxoguanine DNA glycosylase